MAITLVGTASNSAANGNDVSLSLPGATATNDIVLVIGGHGNTTGDAGVNSGGYTEVIDRDRGGCQLSVSWKRMGGSPDSTVSCKGSGNANDATAYVAMVFRGVDPGTALDATSTSDENTGKTPNSPSITTVTNYAAVITCCIHAADNSLTTPSGYQNRVQVSRTDTQPVSVAAAWAYVPSAGSENPPSWSASNSAAWVAASIALRPEIVGYVVDSVASFTGTSAVSFVNGTQSVLYSPCTSAVAFTGRADIGAPFSMTGTGTVAWEGTGASPNPAPFSMTGTAAVSFFGSLQGAGNLAATGTGAVSFVGDYPVDSVFAASMSNSIQFVGAKTRLKHVGETIESRGKMAVTVRGI